MCAVLPAGDLTVRISVMEAWPAGPGAVQA